MQVLNSTLRHIFVSYPGDLPGVSGEGCYGVSMETGFHDPDLGVGAAGEHAAVCVDHAGQATRTAEVDGLKQGDTAVYLKDSMPGSCRSGPIFIKHLKSNVYVTLNAIGSLRCNLCSHWLIQIFIT